MDRNAQGRVDTRSDTHHGDETARCRLALLPVEWSALGEQLRLSTSGARLGQHALAYVTYQLAVTAPKVKRTTWPGPRKPKGMQVLDIVGAAARKLGCELTAETIARICPDITYNSVRKAIHTLWQRGTIEQVSRGRYRIAQ